MAFLKPFKDDFHGKRITIFAVNNENPKTSKASHVTLSYECPHCKERNVYRVYDPIGTYEDNKRRFEVYVCMCASCKNLFNLELDYEINE